MPPAPTRRIVVGSLLGVFCGQTIHSMSTASEEVNRTLPARKTIVHLLLAVFTKPERHKAQRYRRTDTQTVGGTDQRTDMITIADGLRTK